MSSTTSKKGLDNFKRLNRSVYVHQPTSSTTSSRDPDLILLATWMDASTRHIAKYTTAYEKLYPSAHLVVITVSTVDTILRSRAANLKRIAPVLEIIYALPPDARFLLHNFSNGGSVTATLIADAFQQKLGRPLPVTAMVLDSCPGRATYAATVRAFVVALPKVLLVRWLGIAILTVSFWLMKFSYWIRGQLDVVDLMRKRLNTARLFNTTIPRLYIGSAKDEMVAWKFVEQHAAEAEALGYHVEKEQYLDTGHTAHMIGNEERYWGSVKRIWGIAP